METGVRGVSSASALAPVEEEYSFAHATVTIRGMKLCVEVLQKQVKLQVFSMLIMPNRAETLKFL